MYSMLLLDAILSGAIYHRVLYIMCIYIYNVLFFGGSRVETHTYFSDI